MCLEYFGRGSGILQSRQAILNEFHGASVHRSFLFLIFFGSNATAYRRVPKEKEESDHRR